MTNSIIRKLIRERVEANRLAEGWKENLIFLGAMTLSSIGGVKGQTMSNHTDNRAEITQQLQASYSTIIGYLADMPKQTPEEMSAIKEARIYFESLRDGNTPKALSHEAKTVVDFAISETKKLNGKQLYSLSQTGMNIHSVQ